MFHILFDKHKNFLEFEFDHSQAHKRHSDDVFVVGNFNHGYGGSAPTVRDTIAIDNSVGPCVHSNIDKLGNEMIHMHTENDSPPKGKTNAPNNDAHDNEKNMTFQ